MGKGRGPVRGTPAPPVCWTQGGELKGSSPLRRLAQLMQIGSPVLMVLQDESILSKAGTEQGRLVPPQHRQPLPTVWKPRGNTCPAFLLPGRFEPQLPFPKEPLDWEEDIQLYSWFLDRKVRCVDMGTRGHGAVPVSSRVSPGVPRRHVEGAGWPASFLTLS